MLLKTDMGYLFKSETVKKIEEDFYRRTKTDDILMENAGFAVYKEVCKAAKEPCSILVLVGSGNNGGDGYVAARLLLKKGYEVLVCEIFPAKTELCKAKKELYNDAVAEYSEELINRADIIVDAVLGTGFKGTADAYLTEVFEAVNNSKAIKIAVDIPSGLTADECVVNSPCIKADTTVTFISYKKCLLHFPSAELCGKVILNELNLQEFLRHYKNEGTVTEEVRLAKRKRNTHKGTYGTAALICGSYGMAGAAVLSARACIRSGVGIAKLVLDKSIYPIVTACVPEAVCVTDTDNVSVVARETEAANSVLIGCGLSQSKTAEKMLSLAIENAKNTLIIDADGLNLIARRIDFIEGVKAELILTPHPKEMSRIISVSVGEIEADRPYYASLLAKKLGATVVLKGAVTVISDKDGNLYYNTTGNAGMATGGSGDVLSGIIASLSAGGMSALEAAVSGVYIHGLAGDIAKQKFGEISLTPSDIIDALPEAFKKVGE